MGPSRSLPHASPSCCLVAPRQHAAPVFGQVVNGNGARLAAPGTERPDEQQAQPPAEHLAGQRNQQVGCSWVGWRAAPACLLLAPARRGSSAPAGPSWQQAPSPPICPLCLHRHLRPCRLEQAPAAAAHPEPGPPAQGRDAAAGAGAPASPTSSAGAAAAAAAAEPVSGSDSDSDTEQGEQAVIELAARFRDALVRGGRSSVPAACLKGCPTWAWGGVLGLVARVRRALSSRARQAGPSAEPRPAQRVNKQPQLRCQHTHPGALRCAALCLPPCRGQGHRRGGGAVCAVGRRHQWQGAHLDVRPPPGGAHLAHAWQCTAGPLRTRRRGAPMLWLRSRGSSPPGRPRAMPPIRHRGRRAALTLACARRFLLGGSLQLNPGWAQRQPLWAHPPAPSTPHRRLHELAHEDCLGCCVLSKLALFYESKTKTRRRGGSRAGSGDGGSGE